MSGTGAPSFKQLVAISRRRTRVLAPLDRYEDQARRRYRRLTVERVPSDAVYEREVALWDALDGLRTDICAALDRCEAAERRARWGNDERQRP